LFDPDDILGILPGLVTVSSPEKDLEKRRKISLAHFSVKEYLLSNRIRDGPSSKFSLVANDANFSITEICLSYQLQVINSPTISAHTLQKYPLLEYAARYWVQHAKTVDQESWNASLDDLCMRHLGSCGSCFVNWIRICNPDRDSWKEPNYKIKPQDIAPPLYYVASFGVLQAVELLLRDGADINAHGGYFGNALQAASYYGHDQIAQRLLESGANINAPGGYFGNALQAASYQGHDHIVQRLLENGADVNARGEEYGTALQTASYRGHIQIVQRLLKNGADVNAQGGEHGTALQAASYGGRNQIVQRLLENGADVDAQGGYFGTALQAALYKGDDQIVQLLLKNGADVNIKGDDESTALHRAALTGNKVVMRLLLNKRPNVTAKDKSGEIPLHTAAKKGRKMVAWLLLHYCEEHGIAIHDEDMAVAAKLLTDSKSGIICDHCHSFVPNSDPHYHCVICYNDDFDLCQKCVDDGFHCPDKDHRLLKISLKMDD
jgi:ankyrin repeat protein